MVRLGQPSPFTIPASIDLLAGEQQSSKVEIGGSKQQREESLRRTTFPNHTLEIANDFLWNAVPHQ